MYSDTSESSDKKRYFWSRSEISTGLSPDVLGIERYTSRAVVSGGSSEFGVNESQSNDVDLLLLLTTFS